MKQAMFFDSPIGRIGVAEEGGALTNVFYGNTVRPREFEEQETPLLRRAVTQLEEYFTGARREFDLPLSMEGTPFQVRVWEALLEIPYGRTQTYGALALHLFGRANASRAVGHANARNPLSLIVPCHRVIGANGALTGYAGGIPAKEYLLRLEGALQ